MELDVIMPKLGLTMEEGLLVRWLIKTGQPVQAGQVIFEVETDKSVQEVEAPAAGYLCEILVAEGATVPVATPVARISTTAPGPVQEPGRRAAESSPPPAHSGPAPTASDRRTVELQADPGRPFVSWRAKRVAAQLGLDLGALAPGSGPHGRIIERDVRRAAAHLDEGDQADLLELTHLQRVTAGRMAGSFSETPHFYLTVDVNARRLLELRQEQLPLVQQAYGVRLTLSDILVKIAALSLLKHPRANASWSDGKLRLNRAVNIGLATAGPGGLLVPVIHHANQKSLGEIAQLRAHLTGKAQQGRLHLDEMSGGSFTLSNLGMYGVDQFQAIINPPQSVILAVGRIKERPVGENGQVVLKPVFFITLSCDHRVLDGVAGAAFLGDLVRLIEDPSSLT